MTLYYALLFIIPFLVWIGIAKTFFHFDFSWGEVAIQSFVTMAVILFIFATGSASQTRDTKIVNGVVTQLEPKQKNCPSGWVSSSDSFCTEYRTRSVKVGESCSTVNKVRTCTPIYKTEYNYDYPWERRYFVKTDIDTTFEIDRVDRQGSNTPPRFFEIVIGDPVAISVPYTNYIKGASESLFNKTYEELPPIAYPKIRDYYKVYRFLVYGVEFNADDFNQWNKKIAQLNSNVRKTGANFVLIVTKDNQNFGEMMAQAWDAHNINDIVATVGMDGNNVEWVDVRSWSDNSIVEVEIRDSILNIGTLDIDKITATVEQSIMEGFQLKSMDDFEYLAEDIPPPTWAIVLALIVLIIITPVVTYIFNKYDVI